MLRAGLYARVSTNDQQTLAMQNRAMREYAARRGWHGPQPHNIMRSAWPKRIDGGQAGASLENGRKTALQQHKIA